MLFIQIEVYVEAPVGQTETSFTDLVDHSMFATSGIHSWPRSHAVTNNLDRWTSNVSLKLELVPDYLFPFLKVLIHFHVKSSEANLDAVTPGL